MTLLESCPKHNVVAYLEKIDGNTEFHKIIRFLTRSSIHYALTVYYCQSSWQACVYLRASIRSDLLFDDADGIDSLPNQAIFDAIQLMGPSPTTYIPDSIPEGSSRNHGDQAKEIKHLKAQIKKLKKKAKPVITHHKAWIKSGRKLAKAEPTVHKDPAFDELDDDTMDYMKTEDAQDMGRTRYVVHEEKESAEKGVSTEDILSTAQPKVSTDKPEDSTNKPDEGNDKPKVSTDKEEVSTDRLDEGTVDHNEGRSATQTAPTTTTPTIFGDDETIA
ncbi:hypothetical protein Tco_1108831 [Tanacetum coccineum]